MPLLLADFIHIKVCKPNLRKTLDITNSADRRYKIKFEVYRQTEEWHCKLQYHSLLQYICRVKHTSQVCFIRSHS